MKSQSTTMTGGDGAMSWNRQSARGTIENLTRSSPDGVPMKSRSGHTSRHERVSRSADEAGTAYARTWVISENTPYRLMIILKCARVNSSPNAALLL